MAVTNETPCAEPTARPHAPIIALRERDNLVNAFFTTREAVAGVAEAGDANGPALYDWDFFDAGACSLTPLIGAEGTMNDLAVGSGDDQEYELRARLKGMCDLAQSELKESYEDLGEDELPSYVLSESVDFEVVAWRLAWVLSAARGYGEPDDAGGGGHGWWWCVCHPGKC